MSDAPDRGLHRRRSIRLAEYDYAAPGAYFLTICSHARKCVFGSVVDGQMVLSSPGRIVAACWEAIPEHFRRMALDAFVVMPNHVHGILVITDRAHAREGGKEMPVGASHAMLAREGGEEIPAVGAWHAMPLPTRRRFSAPPADALSAVVGSFKAAATRRINVMQRTPGAPIWQRNYYEHVIRNEDDLQAIRQYIADNPLRWQFDAENPERCSHGDKP
jgi:REP-associated tyrosine transposase